MFIALCGAGTLALASAIGVYVYFSRNLPSPQTIHERHLFQSTKIYDRNGVLLHEVYDPNKGKRVALQLNEIPEHVRRAFLAAEDARFYDNSGIDLQAIVRATLTNVTSRGEKIAGGSTITQQLVKMTLLTDERSVVRKIKEAMLAIKISQSFSKDDLLAMYLNSAYFGSQAYGVESAAHTYFAKPVAELNVAEATLLAGLVRSPSSTNPFKNQDAAKAEQKRVLEQMAKHKFVTESEAEQIAAQPLNYNTTQFAELKAPHFAIWIREQLESNPKYGKAGVYQRGMEVTTTLDFRMQEMAELLVREHVAKLGPFNAKDASLVAINPATGEILAMVGSADYNNKEIKGEVNVALAQRQPGSSIKPITYLAALQKGWTPGTVIEDVATTFPGTPPYRPRNYDGTFRGKVTARQALAMSLNIPAVKALQHVGVPAMIDLARKMGISSFQDPAQYGLALTLGGGEVRLLDLTTAYGVFANQGKYVPWVSILKVTDVQGIVLDQWPGPKPQEVADPGRAYMITSILKDNEARAPAFGPNSPLKLSRPAAVKTGTTDDFKDNWTLGYTGQLVTGVWVGNADNAAMRGTTGLTGAAPIWHDFMEYALAPLPVDPMVAPPGLVKIQVDRETGKLWQEGCKGEPYEDFFSPGSEPKEKCEVPTATPTPTEPPATATPAATATSNAEATRQAQAAADAASQSAQATARARQTPPATQAPVQPTAAPQATGAPTRPPSQPTPTSSPQRSPTSKPTETRVRR
ncbi:MAG: PBP1A family penicillin-binding protein [Chloroflexota bacterium]